MPLKDHVEFDDFKKIITCGEFHLVTVGEPDGDPVLPALAPPAGNVAITSLGVDSTIQLASDNLAVTCGATKLGMTEKSGIVFDSDEKFLTTLQVSNNEDVVFQMNKAGINLTFNVGANPAIFNMAKNLVSLNIGAKSSIIMTDEAITFSVGVDALGLGGTKMELTANGIVITAPKVEYNLTQQHKVTVGTVGNNAISTITPGKILETVGQSERKLIGRGHTLTSAESTAQVTPATFRAESVSVTLKSDAAVDFKGTMARGNSDTLWTLVARMFKWN